MSCPVCYAPTDPVVRESLNLGIAVLLGVTALVLAGITRFIFAVVRRSRESESHHNDAVVTSSRARICDPVDHPAKPLGPELA
jgi:hypothetical protein